MARRRAIVLGAVQLLIIGHVALWALSRHYGWWGGRTLSPIEPSEAMQFSRGGIVNAGTIFFALALLSTLVLGRWFCGWACHVVMLQDLCGWLMRKCGIPPKPFRSRLLVYAPLALGCYMFLWPAVQRAAIQVLGEDRPGYDEHQNRSLALAAPVGDAESLPPWQLRLHLTEKHFWATFPGPWLAVPFLVLCGFATVYFLGNKGFCTYCCPYGGFFAPLDRLAIGRIRVTDDCEHCGHCTAVCTSNVRVHEEVRDFGMVVNPGCMKCMDCVSVCPNDALYFGFGSIRPVPTRPLREAARVSKEFRQSSRKTDLTFAEELSLGGVMLLSYVALSGSLPSLMSIGGAAVFAFLAWKCAKLIRQPQVFLNRTRLQSHGRLTALGRITVAVTFAAALIIAHCGAVHAFEWKGEYHYSRLQARMKARHSTSPHKRASQELSKNWTADMHRDAALAIASYRTATDWSGGGIALIANARLEVRLAWLHAARADYAQASQHLRRAMAVSPPSEILTQTLTTLTRLAHKSNPLPQSQFSIP